MGKMTRARKASWARPRRLTKPRPESVSTFGETLRCLASASQSSGAHPRRNMRTISPS